LKPLHRPLSPSKRLVRILRSIVQAATDLVPICDAKPAAFHKFVDPLVDDAFDMAKALVAALPIRLTQTPTTTSVGRHGRDGHPPARRSGFSPVAP
jgi:hypothetical protein